MLVKIALFNHSFLVVTSLILQILACSTFHWSITLSFDLSFTCVIRIQSKNGKQNVPLSTATVSMVHSVPELKVSSEVSTMTLSLVISFTVAPQSRSLIIGVSSMLYILHTESFASLWRGIWCWTSVAWGFFEFTLMQVDYYRVL